VNTAVAFTGYFHGCFVLMMVRKISALKLQKRNKNRVNIYLDGEYAFGLAKIVSAWLKVGQELTDEKIKQLQEQDTTEVALQKAITFLSYKPRSEGEVRKNLKKKGVDDHVITEVMERLQSGGLVDDQKFAHLWIENRSEFRPRGSRVLRMELRQKGIHEEIIDSVTSNIDEDHLAYQAATKQARKYQQLEWQEFRKKMYGFLARRGFDYGIISTIVQKTWEELSPHENRS
jgi:regulatory protein